MASYDYRFDDNEMFRKSYSLYAKNSLTGEYVSKEFADRSDRLTREHYSKQQILGQILLNYNRKFADRHSVGATSKPRRSAGKETTTTSTVTLRSAHRISQP